jgi:two-component sensor histidine kinase
VRENHPFELEVRDDGVEIPKELNISRTETPGLQFIILLVRQPNRTRTHLKILSSELKNKPTF